MQHREEIDGLRAFAVLAVVFCHARIPFFAGGYIGVDIFFVISGYLITSIVAASHARGEFSFKSFYMRRVRRILPALYLVMAATIPMAIYLMPDAQLREFGKSLIAVPLFVSNFLFMRDTGYFAQSSELKPLLHTWSLSVEEQYYFVYPWMLLAMLAWGRKMALIALSVLAVVALAFAHWGSFAYPEKNFYFTISRLSPILGGCVLAIWQRDSGGLPDPRKRWLHETMAWLGVLILFAAVLMFDESTRFPGVASAVPALGTMLVLAGVGHRTVANRLLAWKPLTQIGLASYGAYLWHQPLFSFARIQSMGHAGLEVFVPLTALSVALGWLSWRFFEAPFRSPTRVGARWLGAMLISASLVFIVLGLFMYRGADFPGRPSLPAALIASFERTSRVDECIDLPLGDTKPLTCAIGTERPSFALLGDSHALSMLGAFDEWAARSGVGGVFAARSGCPPLLGVSLRNGASRDDCREFNKQVFEVVKAEKIRDVFWVARWSYYTNGDYVGNGMSYIGLSPQSPATREVSRQAFDAATQSTVEAYRAAGIRLHVMGQVPFQLEDPRAFYFNLYRRSEGGRAQTLEDRSVSRLQHESLQTFANAALRRTGVDFLDPADSLCAGPKCLMGEVGESYYFDKDHLSTVGAKRIMQPLWSAIKDR